jgi:hypothetical protein
MENADRGALPDDRVPGLIPCVYLNGKRFRLRWHGLNRLISAGNPPAFRFFAKKEDLAAIKFPFA